MIWKYVSTQRLEALAAANSQVASKEQLLYLLFVILLSSNDDEIIRKCLNGELKIYETDVTVTRKP